MDKDVIHKVYVRKTEDEMLNIRISMIISSKILNMFMNRKPEESLSETITRIKCNIINKTNRFSKKRKQDMPEGMEEVQIKMFKHDDKIDYSDVKSLSEVRLTEIDANTTTCKEAFTVDSHRNILLCGPYYYKIDYNPPMVDGLSLPTCIRPGFVIYPNDLKLHNCTFEECKVVWYVNKKVYKDFVKDAPMEQIHEGHTLNIKEEYLNKQLKVSIYLPLPYILVRYLYLHVITG